MTITIFDSNGNPTFSAEHTAPNELQGQYRSAFFKDSGSRAMNIDGSSTPVDFTITPTALKKFFIHSLSFALEDTAINFTKFGGIANGLTNGLLLKVTESGVERDLIEFPVKNNAGFMTFDSQLETSTTDILIARFNIFVNSGTVFELKASTNDNLKITIQDDLTPLNAFQAFVVGYEVTE